MSQYGALLVARHGATETHLVVLTELAVEQLEVGQRVACELQVTVQLH
jgi:hypothetical protein